MDDQGAPGGDRFAAIEARLAAEVAAAIRAADDCADDVAAYHHAGKVIRILQDGLATAGDHRRAILARIRDTGQLSLARLGDKIGVSKARAAELMQKAKGPPA